MNVPLLDLKAHHQPLRKELLAALEQVLDKNNFILGNEVAELEEKIAAYCPIRFGVGASRSKASGQGSIIRCLCIGKTLSKPLAITKVISLKQNGPAVSCWHFPFILS